MLRQRLISGTLLALGIVALLALDGWLAERVAPGPRDSLAAAAAAWLANGAVCTAIVLVLTLLATRELLRFASSAGDSRAFAGVAYVFSAGLVVGPYVSFNLRADAPWHDESWGIMWLAIALGLAFVLQAAYRRSERAIVNLAVTIFITFYAGGLAGHMTKLRMEIGGWDGMAVLLFSMFVVKMTDVGAFFVGGLLGRHKLIEWLSPKKTWEGLAGGVLTAVVSAIAVGAVLDHQHLHLSRGWLAYPGGMIVFGMLMAAAAVAGDLFASLLKRDAALKDSGRAIPGMGGILDVLDSPLLAAPAAWFFWTRLAPLAG